MDTIKFADGSVYDCPFFATTPDRAYVALANVDFPTVATIFSNSAKTARMEYGATTVTGFEVLLSINTQPYGIQAVMQKGTMEQSEETT